MLQVERKGQIGFLRLDRPQVLNALNTGLMRQLVETMEEMDRDDQIRVLLLTGGDKAFAAGADISEMAELSPADFVVQKFFSDWERIRRISKPIIAAVSGYALGGGCELAMCCDLIIAADNARFGQPEVNLGVMPGAGGTQRLTRAIGKVRAMEMILTGRPIQAEEAHAMGLINRVVPHAQLEIEAMKLAEEIASKPPLAVRVAKQSILKAMDVSLEDGLHFEQNSFYLLFSSLDQKEGMDAFVEKRKPVFQGK